MFIAPDIAFVVFSLPAAYTGYVGTAEDLLRFLNAVVPGQRISIVIKTDHTSSLAHGRLLLHTVNVYGLFRAADAVRAGRKGLAGARDPAGRRAALQKKTDSICCAVC